MKKQLLLPLVFCAISLNVQAASWGTQAQNGYTAPKVVTPSFKVATPSGWGKTSTYSGSTNSNNAITTGWSIQGYKAPAGQTSQSKGWGGKQTKGWGSGSGWGSQKNNTWGAVLGKDIEKGVTGGGWSFNGAEKKTKGIVKQGAIGILDKILK